MELRVDRDIEAPSSVVWHVITDLDRTAEVLSGVVWIERVDEGHGFEVGTRWRETRTMFGREATEEMEVIAVAPGSSYTVVSESGKTRYTSVLTVEPVSDTRTRLSMSFGAHPSGPVATVLGATIGRLFRGATRRVLEQDLADIARVAEGDPESRT